MQTFKDREQQEWEIDLPFGEVERIKEESKGEFDLTEPQTGDLGKRLDEDLGLFWKLLWFIVRPQAATVMPTAKELRWRGNAEAFPGVPGITAAEFGRRMAGNCLIEADQKFRTEWADFFRQIQRPQTAEALEKIALIHSATVAKVQAKVAASQTLQAMQPKIEAIIDRQLASEFSDWEASLESTLADLLTESSGSDTKESPNTPAQS